MKLVCKNCCLFSFSFQSQREKLTWAYLLHFFKEEWDQEVLALSLRHFSRRWL